MRHSGAIPCVSASTRHRQIDCKDIDKISKQLLTGIIVDFILWLGEKDNLWFGFSFLLPVLFMSVEYEPFSAISIAC